jgi:hypothetical protein
MMTEIVELTISCLKYQETYTRSKAKHIKKETMHNITPQEEETSILTVDLEDEDKDKVWAEAEEK